MGKAFFPLDEELRLLPGQLAPRQQEHLVHLAAWMPFEKAAQMLDDLLSVKISLETVRRLSEQMGTCMQAAQTQEREASCSPTPLESAERPRKVYSVDGAMVPLVNHQWAEVRTLAIGEPFERLSTSGEREIHVGQLSYFSRLAPASLFTQLAQVELDRRRISEAAEVCAVTDGAEWCQAFVQAHRPDAVHVLDFPHAAQHLSDLLVALEQAGVRFPPEMLVRCLHVLKHRGPRPLLRLAQSISQELAQRKAIADPLEYLRKRESQMQYPQVHEQGWPIGSGMVESANKTVVQARLKGAGMHWHRRHINPMLALRNAVCNDRWQEMWQRAVEERLLARTHKGPPSTPPLAQAEVVVDLLPEATAHQPARSLRPRRGPSRQRAHPPLPRPSHCSCGTPLHQKATGRPRLFCSARCQQRDTEPRRATALSEPVPPTPQAPIRADAVAPFKRERPSHCPCGTPLLQKRGARPRRYCSQACRQRAYEQRHAMSS